MANGTGPQYEVVAPDGTRGSVSESDRARVSGGYKLTGRVKMFAPDGTPGFVDPQSLREATKAGYQTTPKTQFEINRPGTGINLSGSGAAAWETLKGLPAAIGKQLDPTQPFRHPEEIPVVQAVKEAKAGYQRGNESALRSGAFPSNRPPTAEETLTQFSPLLEAVTSGAGSLFGMSGKAAAEHAARGEGGAILGEAAVPAALAAGSLGVEPLLKTIPGVKQAIAEKTRVPPTEANPNGALNQSTRNISRAGGFITGMGLSPVAKWEAGLVGAAFGPTLADWMLPKRVIPEAAALFERTKALTEAHEGALAENAARQKTARIENTRLQREVKNAADTALKARDKTAQDLLDRQAAQDKLDTTAARASNEAARTKREALKTRDQTGEDLMRRQKEQDALDKAAKNAIDEAQSARDQHAQDLMDRQKQQDVLDANHAQALKALEDARQKELAANEQFKLQHAEALNKRGGILKGNPTPFPSRETLDLQGNPSGQGLLSRTKKLVRPGETPSIEDLKRAGDMTQVPLPTLKSLARFGDKIAENEINRRIKNRPSVGIVGKTGNP